MKCRRNDTFCVDRRLRRIEEYYGAEQNIFFFLIGNIELCRGLCVPRFIYVRVFLPRIHQLLPAKIGRKTFLVEKKNEKINRIKYINKINIYASRHKI